MFTITQRFVLAGKAYFTVWSKKSGDRKHYTYRITKKDAEGNWPDTYFVSLLNGPDNSTSYVYLGILSEKTGKVRVTAKSKFKSDSLPVRVVNWALEKVWDEQEFPKEAGIDGEGRCGRCGRKLTHPDGIANDGYRLGFGPECWEKLC